MTQREFIDKISSCAVRDMEAGGILASVTIAQAILESGYGSSELAVMANNLFGMKCSLSGNTWKSCWDFKSKYSVFTKEQDKDGKESTILANFRKYSSWEESVADHSLYLLGAMNGKELRYKGLAGEKDPRKAIQIIKDGDYATDVKYVDKVMSIIEKFNLTQYDRSSDVKKEEDVMSIKVVEKYAVNNPCYRAGATITPKGEMLHSVGCPQPDPLVFVRIWQQSNAQVCVHAVVGVEPVVYLLLPYNRRAWHCGGAGNSTLISMEMTEPSTIKYTGGATWVETGNGANTKAHVLATYKNAVEFFAFLAKKYGFNPLDSNVVMSHHEGNVKGIASNHGDVEHIWNKFGLTMNQFRKDVKAAMGGATINTVPSTPVDTSSDDTSKQAIKPLSGSVTIIYKGDDGLNIRNAPCALDKYVERVEYKGTFTVVGISADEKWYKLKSGLFITTIPEYVSFKATEEQKASTAGTGYFRVRKEWSKADTQIGAFKNKDNAIDLCKQNSDYKVFNNDGIEVYPCTVTYPSCPFKFHVDIPDLRIRKGAGTTYDYHKKNGQPVYTGVNTFTIVKTKDGQGAKLWGLLKSYADNEDGWIALDEEYGHRC